MPQIWPLNSLLFVTRHPSQFLRVTNPANARHFIVQKKLSFYSKRCVLQKQRIVGQNWFWKTDRVWDGAWKWIDITWIGGGELRPFSSCETQFSICRFIVSDGSQFHASISTPSSFGHPPKSTRYQPNRWLRTRKLPYIRVPRNGIHGSYRIPKSVDNQIENRL